MPYRNQPSVSFAKKAMADWMASLAGARLLISSSFSSRPARFDDVLFFPDPSGTSCACRYINMAICLMRGSFILAVLTRCDSPASAKALMTAASAPILASTTATPFKMSERYRSDDVSR